MTGHRLRLRFLPDGAEVSVPVSPAVRNSVVVPPDAFVTLT